MVRKRLGDAVALIVLVAPAILLAARLSARGFSCGVVVNAFDVRFVNYLLEWGYQHLVGRAGGDLWSPPFFYPTPHVLGYSETFFSAYPFYFVARLFGASPAAALIGYQLVQLALTAVITYLCARILGFGRLASFLAAQGFAWGWPRYNQLAHLQFANGWVVPAFFVSLYLGWRRGRPWLVAVAAWALCDAFYSAVYIAYFLVLTGTMAIALAILQVRLRTLDSVRAFAASLRSFRLPVLAAWVVITALPLLLVALGALQYRVAARETGPSNPDEMLTYQASIWSWIRPESDGLVWRYLADLFPPDPVAPWEKQMFLGWVTIGCMLLVLLWRKATAVDGPLPRVAARATAGTVLLSILLVSHFPFRALNWPFFAAVKLLPGFASLRVSGRIVLVVAALAGLVTVAVIEQLRRTLPSVAGFAAALFLLENLTPLPPTADRCEAERPWKSLQPFLCGIAHSAGAGSVLFLPMDEISLERIFAQVPEMSVAFDCGIATINGYSAREPPSLRSLFHGDASHFDCAAAQRALDAARAASGRAALIYLEESGPLGAPAYPAREVMTCFDGCVSQTSPALADGRRGSILTVPATGVCIREKR